MRDVRDKVLIVGPSWVGDMVMAHGLVQVLAADGPVRLSVLAHAFMSSLHTRMPAVTDTMRKPILNGSLQILGRVRLAVVVRLL